MITGITLAGFKCFLDLKIAPTLITVLIGPNGSGKSGVLQALLLLKQSKNPAERLDLVGDVFSFSPEDFFFHGQGTAGDLVQIGLRGHGEVQTERVEFEINLQYGRSMALVPPKGGHMSFDYRGNEYDIRAGSRGIRDVQLGGDGVVNLLEGNGIDLIKFNSAPEAASQLANFVREASGLPTRILADITWVPPSRSLTRESYPMGPELSTHISTAKGPSKQEEDAATTMGYSQERLEQASRWMKQITGVGIRVPIIPPTSAQPLSTSVAGDVSVLAEGSGTNSLLMLLFELARASEGATFLIEEPENHLHPKAQADLAAVISQEAVDANKQVIIATHSEHLVNRLLTRVAAGKISTDMLALYSFSKDEHGACSAEEIEITERGQTVGGVTGFFDTNLAEMEEHLRVLREDP